ncbi:MAG: family ATPase [Steroidobacteraceae bacterium]|jgi:SpoVK/Ycf46/Vps4 family AAA+-type ATPase|nr:family ATPase [Steroidobacteraceae bacterium]
MKAASAATSPSDELQTLLASRVAMVVIESREEGRALEVLRDAAMKAQRGKNWGIFQWTVTDGLSRIDVDMGGAQKTLAQPEQLLKHIRATTMAGIYVLLDFHPYLDNPMFVRTLKDIAQDYRKCARTLVLISHEMKLPQELEHLSARFKMSLPTKQERHAIVMRMAREWAQQKGGMPKIDMKVVERMVDNLGGLTENDVERLARQAVFNDGALTEEDIKPMLAAKYQLLNRGGTLSFEPDTARFAEVGGLKNLRRWILQRKAAFDGSAPGLDAPKGVLLLGVQGCGKSLAARAAAGVLGVPLVRLDFGALFSKWHGESEKNLRESLSSAEALAPCVLWLDEIEKALSTGDGDSGTSRRVLGAFLTWLSEQRARVFIVATANDITALPPELVRKGRFDEIFFVDLPTPAARLEILDIHCKKRDVAVGENDMKVLAARCEGFSGAEIEQAVVSALYTAHANNQKVDARCIAAEIEATRPLSVVLGEKIAELRAWAAERTVPAD